ncbi:hypothetical protein [Caulobacter sp. S45]|uniref:hypothetical protein n=1 Tax=Caulobacter sp. S45 TaxID=1641861 RepID=UPI0015771B35|nr:hypothetical protein [Caulobacter sp. S45]
MADVGAKRREERVKLFASALSNVGVAFGVAGVVGPSVIGHFNLPVALGSALVGSGFHLLAQCILHYVISDTPDGDDVGEYR